MHGQNHIKFGIILFVYVVPAAAGIFIVIGQAFVFHLDSSPCRVLLAILSQPSPPHDHLQICHHQDSASALGTFDDRSLTNCHDKISIYAGSLVTKRIFSDRPSVFLLPLVLWVRQGKGGRTRTDKIDVGAGADIGDTGISCNFMARQYTGPTRQSYRNDQRHVGAMPATPSINRFVVRRLIPAVTERYYWVAACYHFPPVCVASSWRPVISLSKSFVKPPRTPPFLIVTSHNSIIQLSKSKPCFYLFYSLRH